MPKNSTRSGASLSGVAAGLSNHLALEQVPLDRLKFFDRALKKHPERQIVKLAASIEEFGFLVPILIDDTFRVIAGQARIEAARRAGLVSVPALRVSHLSETEVRAYRIADNKLAELATWDEEVLRVELAEIHHLVPELDLEILGFETAEIDLLLEIPGAAASDPADALPALGPAVTRPGDLWQLGRHRLLCADATVPEGYAELMAGAQADMVFTDPPYNVPIHGHVSGLGRVRHREFAMASGEMSEADFTAFLADVLAQLAAACREGALLDVCMDWRHLHELMTAGRRAELSLLNLCVWNKDNAGMGSLYRSKHELVLIYKKGGAPHLNTVELGRHGRYRSNVWDYPGANSFRAGRQSELAGHPTPKPVALVADAIKDCTRRGEIVLDAFLGSGTTLIAAEKSGRVCHGLEIDPAYVDQTIRRWQALTGETALHARTGAPFAALAETRSTAAPPPSAVATGCNGPLQVRHRVRPAGGFRPAQEG